MNSLEKRLQIGLALILLIATIGAGWAIYSVIITMGESTIRTRLEHDGEALLAALKFDANGMATLREDRLTGIYQRPFSGHYFHILVGGTQTIVSRSVWDQLFEIDTVTFNNSTAHAVGPNLQQLLLWSNQYSKQGHQITIVTAEDLGPLYQQLKHYGLYLALFMPLFLILVLAIQRLILRYSFRPLDKIRRELKQLERGEIEQLVTPLPSEIAPLVNEVNHLILAMVERIKRSRNSAGNMAHTLKGPLQLLIQLAESERLDGHDDIRQGLLQQVGQIQQQLEIELRRARLAGSASPGQQFQPAAELPLLQRMLQQIYQKRPLSFLFDYPEAATMALDRDDMLELLGTLLDNAAKWAHSQITCKLELGDQLTITIEDDGPGCPPERLEQLTERGVRVDESTIGHGLGLSIAREIVESYRGKMVLGSAPLLGGFSVVITIPLELRSDPK